MNLLTDTLVAWRLLVKNKSSFLINIAGLAIGLAGFICIMLYAEHELSFDKFHTRYADTYRVVKDFVNDGAAVPDATTVPALAKALRVELPEVETSTRIFPNRNRLFLVQYEDKRFYETRLMSVDSMFFDVFDFPFVTGNKEKALGPNSILITESTAARYFGTENPMGKTVRLNLNGGTDYQVSGVVKDVPENSHFSFDLLILFTGRRDPNTNWDFSGFYTYARLKPGASESNFTANVSNLVKRHVPQSQDRYYVQRLEDIHLESNLKWELSPNGDITYIRMLVLIGAFILIIACINYINLVTARSSERAREVGVRKALGAVRGRLIRQFFVESILTVIASMILALFLASIVLPFSRSIAGIDLSSLLFSSKVIMWIVPFTLVIAAVAGFYPAIYLSGFQPLRALRGILVQGRQGAPLRKTLVVFQFAMSSGLIAGMLIISSQFNYMKHKDLGFNKGNVLIAPNVRGGVGGESTAPGSWDEKIKEVPGVVNFSRADGVLGMTNSTNGVTSVASDARITLNFIRVDYEFIPTMEIGLLEGRNFSKDYISDTTGIILNNEAVRQLGLQEPVLGQQIAWDDQAGETHNVTIIGIANDFHFTSLDKAIAPFGFILEVGNGSNFFIKIAPGNVESTRAEIEKVWNTYNPGRPFMYTFQDHYIARLHAGDARFEKLFSIFTVLAIAIASLGLFGLTAFIAEARTKEIGLRKILGASVISILKLISRDHMYMIALSLIIAFPLTYFLMQKWLESFAYKITPDWVTFALAGGISVALALITISLRSLKVATSNPIDSLRSE